MAVADNIWPRIWRRLRSHPRRLLFVCGLLLLLALFALTLRPAQNGRSNQSLIPTLPLGAVAPVFSLKYLEGKPISLAALRGYPVVLNFWATTCPPCRQEMPALQRLFRRLHSGHQGTILGIDADAEDQSQVTAYVRRVGVRYPILLDPLFQATIVLYHIANIPSTVVLDGAGRVRYVKVGSLSDADLAHLPALGT